MRNLCISALGLALVAWTGAAMAADAWNIDTDHTSVHFKIRHMMVSNVNGEFSGVKGTFDLEGKDAAKWKAQAEVPVSTISTKNEKRDTHLKSADFFDAAKYPTLTFKSTKFEKDGENYKMKGNLTMHGVTKEVTWTLTSLTDAVKDPGGNMRRGFAAETKLKRGDFGLKWNKALETGGAIVGDDVTVSVDGEVTKASAEKPKKS